MDSSHMLCQTVRPRKCLSTLRVLARKPLSLAFRVMCPHVLPHISLIRHPYIRTIRTLHGHVVASEMFTDRCELMTYI